VVLMLYQKGTRRTQVSTSANDNGLLILSVMLVLLILLVLTFVGAVCMCQKHYFATMPYCIKH
jgi:hypothetical protein